MQRLRFNYSKKAALRYTSNLDVHRIWERSLRRAGLPLAYSQGFHPQPRLNQACPLPLGVTSGCEMIDAWFEPDVDPDQAVQALAPAVPPGLEVLSAQPVDLHAPSLPTQVTASIYEITFLDPVGMEMIENQLAELLGADHLPREYRGKSYDLRPLIEAAALLPPDSAGRVHLSLRLSAREGATGRADETIAALGFDPFNARIERVQLILL